MIWYLDASVALHALLPGGDPRAAEWLDRANQEGAVYSSSLLELELIRVLRRERLPIERSREVIDRVALITVDDSALRAAGAIEQHIRSLDAIHLATCDLLGDAAVLVSHDARMGEVARERGRSVVDPLTGATLEGE